MITKKDIMDYLVFYFTMIHGYKTGHSKVMARDIAKALMKKFKEKELLETSIEKAEKDILVEILRKEKKISKKEIKEFLFL